MASRAHRSEPDRGLASPAQERLAAIAAHLVEHPLQSVAEATRADPVAPIQTAARSSVSMRQAFDAAPELLNVRETAVLLRIHLQSVYTLIHMRRLAAIRPGGLRRWLIPKQAVVHMIERSDDDAPTHELRGVGDM
ncbi:MAG: helix-turn-helix domain-containing protein [Candidatus Eremiobacteraeota bacterium]|nr:helix-turn-helix domain-containing protein [Candidatus Eremiobacteraeota bacterium]MBC5827837.1 helix-turn-helix domain-containing protein [Candidatus Eremiobacteraeota bacterium]